MLVGNEGTVSGQPGSPGGVGGFKEGVGPSGLGTIPEEAWPTQDSHSPPGAKGPGFPGGSGSGRGGRRASRRKGPERRSERTGPVRCNPVGLGQPPGATPGSGAPRDTGGRAAGRTPDPHNGQGRDLPGAPPSPSPGPAPPPPGAGPGSTSRPGPRPGVARSPRGAMASRLLHRLRHALTGDGPGEAAAGPEAEQFPESSELEDDDAEGLSSRLSGTLSFTSAEDDDEEDGEDDDDADPDPLSAGDRVAGEDAGECGRMEAGTLGSVRPPPRPRSRIDPTETRDTSFKCVPLPLGCVTLRDSHHLSGPSSLVSNHSHLRVV